MATPAPMSNLPVYLMEVTMSLAQLNIGQNGEHQDNSFTSTSDSFEDDGNKTDLSRAFGCAQGTTICFATMAREGVQLRKSGMIKTRVYSRLKLP